MADRFLVVGDGRGLDLASGDEVSLIVSPVGDSSEQTRWAARCAWFNQLRHPALAHLADFGACGAFHRFEAWRAIESWTASPETASRIARAATAFLDACDLTSGSLSARDVRSYGGRAVVLPGADAGYETKAGGRRTGVCSLETCGVGVASHPVVSLLSEAIAHASFVRPRAVSLVGRPGTGLDLAIEELARVARTHGFVPLGVDVVTRVPFTLIEGRSIFLIVRSGSPRGWRELLYCTMRSPRAHLLLFAGGEEVCGVPAVVLGRVPVDSLVRATWPRAAVEASRRRIERMARLSGGLPERFMTLLWGREPIGVRPSTRSAQPRAAELPAPYGDASEAGPAPVQRVPAPLRTSLGETAALGRRMAAAVCDLERGRHAPGERGLRSAIAGLARRGRSAEAADGLLSLARFLLKRGRPGDAQATLRHARDYARQAEQDALALEVAVLSGVAWTDLARLDEAESVLTAAMATARSGVGDLECRVAGALALARCLFWKGQYGEAGSLLATIDAAGLPVGLSVRLAASEARVAVGNSDLPGAIAHATVAHDRAKAAGDSSAVAKAAYAGAFVHLALGDRPGVEREAAACIGAARAARDPLVALKARLVAAECERRSGTGTASGLLKRMRRLSHLSLPPTVHARWALLADLLSSASPAHETVKRHASRTCLSALALFGPAERVPSGVRPHASLDEILEVLELLQTSEDDCSVLPQLCSKVRVRLQAAAVAFFGAEGGLLASDGARIEPDVARRVIDAGQSIAPHRLDGGIEGGACIRYGGETLGALVARWTIVCEPDPARTAAMLSITATAAAASVAATLARRQRPVADTGDLLGASPVMAEVRRAVDRAAPTPFAVLVVGESGAELESGFRPRFASELDEGSMAGAGKSGDLTANPCR